MLYFICLLQRWFVTFQVMKSFRLLIALQTFEVVSDPVWINTGVICETGNSILQKILFDR